MTLGRPRMSTSSWRGTARCPAADARHAGRRRRGGDLGRPRSGERTPPAQPARRHPHAIDDGVGRSMAGRPPCCAGTDGDHRLGLGHRGHRLPRRRRHSRRVPRDNGSRNGRAPRWSSPRRGPWHQGRAGRTWPDDAALGSPLAQFVAGKDLSDDDLIALMVAHPALLQRPVVMRGDRAVLARPIEKVRELLRSTPPRRPHGPCARSIRAGRLRLRGGPTGCGRGGRRDQSPRWRLCRWAG